MSSIAPQYTEVYMNILWSIEKYWNALLLEPTHAYQLINYLKFYFD